MFVKQAALEDGVFPTGTRQKHYMSHQIKFLKAYVQIHNSLSAVEEKMLLQLSTTMRPNTLSKGFRISVSICLPGHSIWFFISAKPQISLVAWGPKQEAAFEIIQEAVAHSICLGLHSPNDPFELQISVTNDFAYSSLCQTKATSTQGSLLWSGLDAYMTQLPHFLRSNC